MGCSGHCRRYLTSMHTHRKTANNFLYDMEKINFLSYMKLVLFLMQQRRNHLVRFHYVLYTFSKAAARIEEVESTQPERAINIEVWWDFHWARQQSD